jgi:hypothetical protein
VSSIGVSGRNIQPFIRNDNEPLVAVPDFEPRACRACARKIFISRAASRMPSATEFSLEEAAILFKATFRPLVRGPAPPRRGAESSCKRPRSPSKRSALPLREVPLLFETSPFCSQESALLFEEVAVPLARGPAPLRRGRDPLARGQL